MKLFIICSKKNYGIVPTYKAKLEKLGHEVRLPNCINNPNAEAEAKATGNHVEFKQAMYKQSRVQIEECDAILVINPTRDGINGYIGGATFLEMYEAFQLGKKIYMTDVVEQRVFDDEVNGFAPCIIETCMDIR